MTNFVQEAYKLHLAGDAIGARLHYLAELEGDPKSVPALMNLGQLAADSGQPKVGEILTRKAIDLDPYSTVLWGNLSTFLQMQDKLEEAAEAVEKALSLGPELTSHWRNAGLIRLRQRRYADGVECFKKAIALGDDGHGIRNDLAHGYLALGELKKGLELYESRWAMLRHSPAWDFHIKEWTGQDLNNQWILVHAEQGFGDTIMTMRFIQVLQERYPECEVTLCVPRELVSLCDFVGGFEVYCTDDMSQEFADWFDYHAPLMSMVRWLGIEVQDIKPDPYIHLTDKTVKNIYRVGICWASGRRNSEHDWRGRYTNLSDWLDLATVPGVQLVSLQQGSDANEISRIGAEGLISEREIAGCKDWLDTAEMVASLDCVVTVDTAVAHLAGAMGKFVIMLSQYTNCWRWWNIDEGSGRPWYNDLHIVRQESPGDWKQTLVKAKELLSSALK